MKKSSKSTRRTRSTGRNARLSSMRAWITIYMARGERKRAREQKALVAKLEKKGGR